MQPKSDIDAAQHRGADSDVVEWIEKQDRQLTYSELAAACIERFGADRAWSAVQISDYWQSAHAVLERSPIERDAELLAFLRDRVGRISGEALLKLCRTTFQADRVPSRSALYRWIDRERAKNLAHKNR